MTLMKQTGILALTAFVCMNATADNLDLHFSFGGESEPLQISWVGEEPQFNLTENPRGNSTIKVVGLQHSEALTVTATDESWGAKNEDGDFHDGMILRFVIDDDNEATEHALEQNGRGPIVIDPINSSTVQMLPFYVFRNGGDLLPDATKLWKGKATLRFASNR